MSMKVMLVLPAVILSACASGPETSTGTSKPAEAGTAGDWAPRAPFVEVKATHETVLARRAPITDKWPTFDTPPAGAVRVEYKSSKLGAQPLWGWFAAPEASVEERAEGRPEKAPALVYFHGHFFMTPKDFARVSTLRAKGFAVLTATLRGRNGNAGSHEMLYGEIDDAAAAVEWLAARPDIDPTHIYTFGHSMGGGASALLALLPSLAVRVTGSCGAIYSTATWKNWAAGRDHNLIRFDPNAPLESELRVLLPWANQLAHPHVALMGDEERTTLRNARAVEARAQPNTFAIKVVAGNHSSAIGPAFNAFAAFIVDDARSHEPPNLEAFLK